MDLCEKNLLVMQNEKEIYAEFTGRLSYEKMVGLLCSCDIVVNPINKGAAQSITNKVGDYALSGFLLLIHKNVRSIVCLLIV